MRNKLLYKPWDKLNKKIYNVGNEGNCVIIKRKLRQWNWNFSIAVKKCKWKQKFLLQKDSEKKNLR